MALQVPEPIHELGPSKFRLPVRMQVVARVRGIEGDADELETDADQGASHGRNNRSLFPPPSLSK